MTVGQRCYALHWFSQQRHLSGKVAVLPRRLFPQRRKAGLGCQRCLGSQLAPTCQKSQVLVDLFDNMITGSSGQVRSGQVRSGQVRSGQVCYSAEVQDHEGHAKRTFESEQNQGAQMPLPVSSELESERATSMPVVAIELWWRFKDNRGRWC